MLIVIFLFFSPPPPESEIRARLQSASPTAGRCKTPETFSSKLLLIRQKPLVKQQSVPETLKYFFFPPLYLPPSSSSSSSLISSRLSVLLPASVLHFWKVLLLLLISFLLLPLVYVQEILISTTCSQALSQRDTVQ